VLCTLTERVHYYDIAIIVVITIVYLRLRLGKMVTPPKLISDVKVLNIQHCQEIVHLLLLLYCITNFYEAIKPLINKMLNNRL